MPPTFSLAPFSTGTPAVATAGVAPEASGQRPLLRALTGVRAFAALWVVGLHLQPVTDRLLPEPAAAAFRFAARPGYLGVDLFFVLSGFIISYTYAAAFDRGVTVDRWRRFLGARLARIYPLHACLLAALAIAVLGLGFGRGGVIDDTRWSVSGLVQSALLIHAWTGRETVWNPVSWSISSEWLAYLLFPILSGIAALLVRGGPVSGRGWRAPAPLFWMAAIALVPAAWDTLARVGQPLPAPLPAQILSEFLVGCLTYRYAVITGCLTPGETPAPAPRSSSSASPPSVVTLTSTWAGGLFALGAMVVAMAGVTPRWMVPLIPAVLLGLAAGRGRASALAAHPWSVYWGKVSFALYMTHYLWLWVMHTVLPVAAVASSAPAVRVGAIALHVLPMFVIAAAMYHLVEEPARMWLTGRLRRPGPVHVNPASVAASLAMAGERRR